MSLDKNRNSLWISIPKKGLLGEKFEIAEIIFDDNLNIIEKREMTKNSISNNIRPYNIENDNNIFWLTGNYFYWKKDNEYKGFPLNVKIKRKNI